ncbi:ribonuclease M5 [Streptococcaceae bacterium ESL0729]|nr:ribonuclease M5 [Streptococcaceae bacterium ESL0729]
MLDREKIRISEVVVVEGKDDTRRLKEFFEVETYETRGSAITDEDLEKIEMLDDLRGVIVFTDPDFSGEKIRKKIVQALPGVKQAFLNPQEARPSSKSKGKSLGVEHASYEDLKTALASAHDARVDFPVVDQAVLIELGLIMSSEGRARREFLGEELRIGYTNAKQLPKRLSLFGIDEEQVRKAMNKYNNE